MKDQGCGPARAKGSEKQGLGKGIAEYFKEIGSGTQVLKKHVLGNKVYEAYNMGSGSVCTLKAGCLKNDSTKGPKKVKK